MPIYEYACEKCGHEFEDFVNHCDADDPPCKKCKSKKTKRLMSFCRSVSGSKTSSKTSSCGTSRGFT